MDEFLCLQPTLELLEAGGQGTSIAWELLSHSLFSRLIAIHAFDPTLQIYKVKLSS